METDYHYLFIYLYTNYFQNIIIPVIYVNPPNQFLILNCSCILYFTFYKKVRITANGSLSGFLYLQNYLSFIANVAVCNRWRCSNPSLPFFYSTAWLPLSSFISFLLCLSLCISFPTIRPSPSRKLLSLREDRGRKLE